MLGDFVLERLGILDQSFQRLCLLFQIVRTGPFGGRHAQKNINVWAAGKAHRIERRSYTALPPLHRPGSVRRRRLRGLDDEHVERGRVDA